MKHPIRHSKTLASCPVPPRRAVLSAAVCGAFLASGLLGASTPAAAATVGALAPDVALAGDAAVRQLSAHRGKFVYLDFWASWCVPCKQSFPWMNEMQTRYGAQGLKVVAVNLDTKPDEARRFLAENPAQFDVAFDKAGDSAKAFAIKGMPSSVLIGPDGKVVLVHAGFRDGDKAALEQEIRKALGVK